MTPFTEAERSLLNQSMTQAKLSGHDDVFKTLAGMVDDPDAFRELVASFRKGGDEVAESIIVEGAPGSPPRPGLEWKDSTHRWVNPHTGEEHETTSSSGSGGAERLADSPHLPDEVKKNPKLMARLSDAVVTAAAKLKMTLDKVNASVRLMRLIDKLGTVAGAVLDTPGDLQKLGYNPTTSAGGGDAGDSTPTTNDPMRAATGISTHLACTIASTVLSHGLVYLKRKMRSTSESIEGDEYGDLAAILLSVFESVNASLGLEGVPDVTELAKKLSEMVG